jgi:hypothetical protein
MRRAIQPTAADQHCAERRGRMDDEHRARRTFEIALHDHRIDQRVVEPDPRARAHAACASQRA